MAQDSFKKIMEPLLDHEGGWSDRPLADDPGGKTYKGVIQRTYDAFRSSRGLKLQSVRHMTDGELMTIYDFQFWRPICGDLLPFGVDYAVFDGAVNSGPGQSSKWLQRALKQQGLYSEGVVDGDIGIGTITACNDADPHMLIDSICDQRLAFMKSLSNWNANKNGWQRRVKEVRQAAHNMAQGHKAPPRVTPMPAEETGKAMASNTNVTETPAGNTATKQIGTGVFAIILTWLSQASDYLSYLTGLPSWMVQWIIFGAISLVLIAGISLAAITIYDVIRRKRYKESVEAP